MYGFVVVVGTKVFFREGYTADNKYQAEGFTEGKSYLVVDRGFDPDTDLVLLNDAGDKQTVYIFDVYKTGSGIKTYDGKGETHNNNMEVCV